MVRFGKRPLSRPPQPLAFFCEKTQSRYFKILIFSIHQTVARSLHDLPILLIRYRTDSRLTVISVA
jgi:hypothetical protein